MGGLFSLYAGLHRPDVFGKVAAFSPSVWWGRRDILRRVRRPAGRLAAEPDFRLWLDTGTAESQRPAQVVSGVRALRDAFLQRGWRLGHDLGYLEAEGAGHDERAWGARMEPMLRFLYPAR